MKRFLITSLFVGMVLGFMPRQAAAQQATSSPSLGELARKLRAQRKQAPQNAKVFTNDNLPTSSHSDKSTEASGTAATPAQSGGPEPSTAEAKSSSGGHDEAYFRKRAKELRDQLALHQRELSVLEQKLGQGQIAYYPDPQKTLQQASTPAFYSDENKLRDEIQKKKDQIAEDQKALDDLTDQLRRQGGDPGWIR